MIPDLSKLIHDARADSAVPPEWRLGLLARVEAVRRRRRLQRRFAAATGLAAAAALCIAIASGSRRSVGDAVHFEIDAPAARHVSLVGDFDGWNPSALPMRRSNGGTAWGIDVRLPAGRHTFAYSIDGRLTIDSTDAMAAGDDFGVPTSVIVVASSGRN